MFYVYICKNLLYLFFFHKLTLPCSDGRAAGDGVVHELLERARPHHPDGRISSGPMEPSATRLCRYTELSVSSIPRQQPPTATCAPLALVASSSQ